MRVAFFQHRVFGWAHVYVLLISFRIGQQIHVLKPRKMLQRYRLGGAVIPFQLCNEYFVVHTSQYRNRKNGTDML